MKSESLADADGPDQRLDLEIIDLDGSGDSGDDGAGFRSGSSGSGSSGSSCDYWTDDETDPGSSTR